MIFPLGGALPFLVGRQLICLVKTAGPLPYFPQQSQTELKISTKEKSNVPFPNVLDHIVFVALCARPRMPHAHNQAKVSDNDCL